MSGHINDHRRAAELHDIAAHAHNSAAVAHEKQDHATGHERSRRALEHSAEAFQRSELALAHKAHGIETSGHHEIATMAYAIWQSRGCPEGSPEEDWSRAENAWLAATKGIRL